MNRSFTNKYKNKNYIGKGFIKGFSALLLIWLLTASSINVSAQIERVSKNVQNNAVETDLPGGDLKLVSVRQLNIADAFNQLTAPTAVDPTAVYSNVTTYTGLAFNNGGAAADPAGAANTITRLAADDLTLYGNPPYTITGIRFAVANLNGVAVSARARARFYQADGAGGGPGTLIAGFSFNAFNFSPGVTTLTANVTAFAVNTKTIWAGLTYDNNSGATGATAAQLNNFGEGIFTPVDRGSSADKIFLTTSNGSFLANSPAGATTNFNGNPVANFGWELLTAANVAPTAGGVEVSGRVLTANGAGISKAAMSLTAADGSVRRVLTNNFGYYSFTDVTAGAVYTLSVSARKYTFDQPNQVISLSDNLADQNFTAR